MKNYIINSETCAIISYGGGKSLIYEKNQRIIVDIKPNKIIKKNCYYNGSTYEGRVDATGFLTNYNYKAPILINESENIIFFPTSSPRLDDCSWISLNNIYDYYSINEKICRIIFDNKLFLELPISYNILNNQILRSIKLESKLRKKAL